MVSVVIHDIVSGVQSKSKKKKLNAEWIELRNASEEDADLHGWTIRDKIKSTGEFRTLYTFDRFHLGPGRIVRVHTGSYEDRVERPVDGDLISTVTHLYAGHRNWIWATKGGEVFIMDEDGNKVSYKLRLG